MPYTVAELAQQLRGELVGDGSVLIHGFSAAESARDGDITFAEKDTYFAVAEKSAASAILVSGPFNSNRKPLIRVPNARIAMARLLPFFFPPESHAPGVHSTTAVHATAVVDPTAHVGPHCVIGPKVRIGARSVLMSGNYVGANCALGEDVHLFPNVVIYPGTQIGNRVAIHAGTVIGSDGYGYVFDEGHHRKILHLGNVIIHDDVEIGANSAIDRGALGSTVIGKGTKIDNLVHVAHNVTMGVHCLVLGQVGFAGSTRLGDYSVVASQSGIAGHLTLGPQSTVGAQSGVMRDVPAGAKVLGSPAQPDKQMKRQWIALQQLPDLLKRFRELEEQVRQLSGTTGPTPPPA